MEVMSFHLLRVLTVGKFTDALLFVKITFSIPRFFSFLLCSYKKKEEVNKRICIYRKNENEKMTSMKKENDTLIF